MTAHNRKPPPGMPPLPEPIDVTTLGVEYLRRAVASIPTDLESALAMDAEAMDAEAEAEAMDAEAMDAEAMDAEAMDAEAMDAEAMDAEAMDAEAMDAEAMDAEPEFHIPEDFQRDDFYGPPEHRHRLGELTCPHCYTRKRRAGDHACDHCQTYSDELKTPAPNAARRCKCSLCLEKHGESG